jgi:hypothetical protein
MYTSTYEEQITVEFVQELEAYLNRIRSDGQPVKDDGIYSTHPVHC